MTLPLDLLFVLLLSSGRIVHLNWLGRARRGRIIAIPNNWHADVLFDGWDRAVRADQGSLVWEAVHDGRTA